MKILVVISFVLFVVRGDSSEKQDVKTKNIAPSINTLPQGPKYETYFQPMKIQPPQQKTHYIPVQIIPKPYYVPQTQQPQAMIIIAQPALVPQSLVYGSPTQQLLNYFHNNPQAKYQLLHGNYQPQPTPAYMQVVASPSIGNYILTPAPVAHYQPAQYQPHYQQPAQQPYQPSPAQYQQPAQQAAEQPEQLGNIAHLAQIAAQQYVASPMKAAPAIVTGFEQFTPEQQAQIKAQLSNHLGSNFHAVKYGAERENDDFVPSPQIKIEKGTAQPSTDMLKSRYIKSKN